MLDMPTDPRRTPEEVSAYTTGILYATGWIGEGAFHVTEPSGDDCSTYAWEEWGTHFSDVPEKMKTQFEAGFRAAMDMARAMRRGGADADVVVGSLRHVVSTTRKHTA